MGQLYYNKQGIYVTGESLNIQGGAYPLSTISDVEIRPEYPQRLVPLIFTVVGTLLSPIGLPLLILGGAWLVDWPILIWGLVWLVTGFPLVVWGLIWLTYQRTTYWLTIQTATGRLEVFSTKDTRTIREIQAALTAAIAHTTTMTPPVSRTASNPPPEQRDQLMVQLLKVAQSRGGSLSVTEGVAETGMSFTEVETTLKEMVKAGYVSVDNHPETGVILYKFLELL
jgi:hypothetical protein